MNLAKYIDHTLLKPEATSDDIVQLCKEAKENNFAAVCVNPCWVALCKNELRGTGVKVCTVVGFPLGNNETELKAHETSLTIQAGAHEIDMVINVGWLKEGMKQSVVADIAGVVAAAKNRIVKVIIETSKLTDDEKRLACDLAVKAGADFVKTSTGFGGGGATVEDVKLMKAVVGDKAKVKASGGIKTKEGAEAMIAAGAERLGTSSGIAIVEG